MRCLFSLQHQLLFERGRHAAAAAAATTTAPAPAFALTWAAARQQGSKPAVRRLHTVALLTRGVSERSSAPTTGQPAVAHRADSESDGMFATATTRRSHATGAVEDEDEDEDEEDNFFFRRDGFHVKRGGSDTNGASRSSSRRGASVSGGLVRNEVGRGSGEN